MSDDRGLTPVVAKTLEIGIVLLYVSLVLATLYGGVVPSARTDAAGVVGDRALAAAATNVEDAVPPANAARVRVERRVDLPATLRDRSYSIRADGRALVLDSDAPGVGGRTPLSLPGRVTTVTGSWNATGDAVVVVRGDGDDLTVSLEER
ncbi:MAG: hypothetical protein ABEJ80_05245 [Halarchaeum sp.]